MSLRVMNRVWDHSGQSGSALLLLLALADQANDQGVCWPSVDTLARKTRLSERTVQELINGAAARANHAARAGLTESSELEVLRGGGHGRASTYRITVRDSHPSENGSPNGHLDYGANLAPLAGMNGASPSKEGCELPQERVRVAAKNGAAGRTPTVRNRKGTVYEPPRAGPRSHRSDDGAPHTGGRPTSTYHAGAT